MVRSSVVAFAQLLRRYVDQLIFFFNRPRVSLLGFAMINIVCIAKSFLVQVSCKNPPLCERTELRTFLEYASAFPIFSVAKLFHDPIVIDGLPSSEAVTVVVLGSVAGIFNCLAAGWFFRWVTKAVVSGFRGHKEKVFAFAVATVWFACVVVLMTEPSGVFLAALVLGGGGMLVYLTMCAMGAIVRCVRS